MRKNALKKLKFHTNLCMCVTRPSYLRAIKMLNNFKRQYKKMLDYIYVSMFAIN